MKLIVGLGNPGKQYQNTRHNAGFMALDRIARDESISPVDEDLQLSLNKRLKSRIAYTVRKGEKIILVKPETFMNASGLAVAAVMKYYKADIDDLIVILDDVDLPIGESRIRLAGGSAGQKGLQNIIDTLGSDQFIRVRLGINSNVMRTDIQDKGQNKIDTADYVLQEFRDRELPVLEQVINETVIYLVSNLGTKDLIQAKTIRVSR